MNALRLKETLQAWQNLLPNHNLLSKYQIAPSEFDIIFEKYNIQLVKYHNGLSSGLTAGLNSGLSSNKNNEIKKPILIIPSLINRHYVLDLLPNKSLIQYLLNQNLEVYMIHWTPPEPEHQFLTKEIFFEYLLPLVLDQVQIHSKQEKIHLWGHCLGGTISSVLGSLYPDRFQSLTLITSPIDFSEMGKLGLWANAPDFDVQSFIDSYGNMPWPMLQSSFQFIKPSLWFSKIRTLSEKYLDETFMTNFIALEIWSADNLDFPGQLYKMIIQDFYQKNKLIKNQFLINSKTVSLNEITCPIMNLMSSEDNIVPTHSGLRKEHVSENLNLENKIVKGGHIGAVLGSKAQKNLWPEMISWIQNAEKLN